MSDLIHNERTKLLANALDRLSTAFVAVSVLAPLTATVVSGLASTVQALALWGITATSILVALLLHLAARSVLGGLKA